MAQFFFKPKRVLVPVKGRRADRDAFRLACNLAREAKGKLYALYVIEVSRKHPVDAEMPSEVAKGEKILADVEAMGREEKADVSAALLQARQAGPAIVHEAKERQVDLIVLGTPPLAPARGKVERGGETVSYILQNAPCTVLLWRDNAVAEGEV
jgi:nucleotide-binding universal stress UspA family protein